MTVVPLPAAPIHPIEVGKIEASVGCSDGLLVCAREER
jgi:hypothetical protein